VIDKLSLGSLIDRRFMPPRPPTMSWAQVVLLDGILRGAGICKDGDS